MSYSLLYKLPDIPSPFPFRFPFPFPFAMPSIHCSFPCPSFNLPLHPWLLCYRISFLCCLATLWTDLLNIIHIVDGQWFLLANKKLNVGLVCWLDLVTCSCSVSPSSSSCFHSHSHSSRLVSFGSRLVVVFYYDNCLPSARVTVRPWSHLRHLTMQLAAGRERRERERESRLWIAVSTGRITRH